MASIHTNFWTILEQYDPRVYDIKIRKKIGNKVTITVSRKILFLKIFGYDISKKMFEIEWEIDKHNVSNIINPDFKDDKNVDCLAFMAYAEIGFNENKINILDALSGIKMPDNTIASIEEFNYRLDLLHCAVGMVDEAGEILDHIKKYVYHNKPFDKAAVASEFGDQEWYKFNALRLMKISFSDTLKSNKIKLDSRYPQGRDKNYIHQVGLKNVEEENNLIRNKLYNNEN